MMIDFLILGPMHMSHSHLHVYYYMMNTDLIQHCKIIAFDKVLRIVFWELSTGFISLYCNQRFGLVYVCHTHNEIDIDIPSTVAIDTCTWSL